MINIDAYSEKEKIALVALYYASLKSSDPEYADMKKNFFILSEAYGTKANTIKNWKDAYDAKFDDNGRKGWHDKELHERDKILSAVYEEIIESNKYTKEDIKNTVTKIISDVSIGFINDKTIKIFLLKDDDVQYGLNWGDRVDSSTGKERDKNEAYLQLTPDVYRTDFFPKKGVYFIVKTDDNNTLILNRAQKDEGSALQTPEDNTIIGLYLRKRLGIEKDQRITKEAITAYGRDYITLRKESDKEYLLDFSNNSEAEPIEEDYNKIIFGAPGTGKSFYLRNLITKYFSNENYERVTFQPNYTYAQFVGTYKPITLKKSDNNNEISYSYVPGPFIRMYLKAKLNPENNYVLAIEEINRANVASVFGDVFQLLDREEDGTSTYPITISEDMKQFFKDNSLNTHELSLPKNLYIWATMNSSDQGVLPMDAAFKRRWDFEYINIDENENWDYEIPVPIDGKIKWNILRKAINDKLKKIPGVNEDKLLGPYFISKSKLDNIQGTPTDEQKNKFIETFKSKVLMYLFEDVCKMRPTALFDVTLEEGQTKPQYSDICKAFDENGIGIFGFKKEDIEAKYIKPSEEAVSEQK